MKNMLRSCFDKQDNIYVDCLSMYATEAQNYEKSFKIPGLLKDKEKDYFDFIVRCYQTSGKTPSQSLFEMNFPETKGQFANARQISDTDLRTYLFQLLDARVNTHISKRITELNKLVADKGITSEIAEEFERLNKISNRNTAKDVNIVLDAKAVYTEKKTKPIGLVTGIKAIDEKIGGMNPGTVTCIAGFTSQYKTTFALNVAHLNAWYNGYNIAYISLETPKEDIYWNLLSCHSYESHLSKFNFVSHGRMRTCKLTPEEEDFVFNEVEPDLKNDYMGNDGKLHPRGQIVFLDESDFDTFSFGEITAVLSKVDEKLQYGLDAVIVDYAQLCKFSGSGMTNDANSQINSYVAFFRRLAQNFKKVKDANGNDVKKELTLIILSQINRESWRRARNNEGKYDLTCLADANELERGSARVFTTFTNEDMKGRKAAQVQILKNRNGPTMYEPSEVIADGEAYVFQDEGSATNTFGGNQEMSVSAALSELGDDLSFLGL